MVTTDMYLDNFQVKVNAQVPVLFLAVLLPIAFFNATLFHSLVEGFAVIVAILTFVVAFNTYQFSQSHFLMFIGCGYFWVGILDFCHTITFSDNNVLGNANEGTTIQFWMVARFLEAFILLGFTSFMDRKIPNSLLFWLIGGAFSVLSFLILMGWFPDLYDEETGLSTSKIIGEYIVIVLLFIAARRVWKRRLKFNSSVYRLLMLSIGLTIAAEVSFTLYSSLSGITIIVGHIFKLMSYWAIYVALVESTLTQPFKSLTLSSSTFNALPDAIVAVSREGEILHVNQSARDASDHPDTMVGMHVHDVFHSKKFASHDCPICRSIYQKEPIHYQEIPLDEKWYAITLTQIKYQDLDNVVLHVSRDITQHKETTTQYHTANRLYTVLRLTNKAIISNSTKEDLLDSICHIAVKHGGFSMAWIGMIEGDDVVPVSSAGDSNYYLTGINVRVDNSEFARGPVGVSGKTGEVAFVNNVELDSSFAPWRRAALSCGFKSLAVIPVIQEDKTIGVFAIYSSEVDAFDTQILELLSSLSDDINSVITYIQAEEKRKIAETKLKQLHLAIEQSKSAIAISDIQGNIEYINPYYSQLTGYEESEVLSQNIDRFSRALVAEQEVLQQCWRRVLEGHDWNGEVMCLRKDGQPYWALLSVSPIFAGKTITHIIWTSKDNTELHEAHETISQLAYYDALTGLPNRRLYHDRFQLALSAAKCHRTKLALMFLDLDNFKSINDSWGHEFGDQLLKHTAITLNNCVREMDTVARLGGDEFCIIINDVEDNADIIHIADNILHALTEKATVSGREMSITTSIGISLYPDDGEEATELIKCADMAMYHAKEKGKNNFQFFEEFLNINAQKRLEFERKIIQAHEDDAFQLYYQPQFNMKTGELTGVEALIRWIDNGRVILPGEFIPISEESSLINDLGEWVVNKACHEFQGLLDKGFPSVKMAVNISANQFHKPGELLDCIENALFESGLSGASLQLELTESSMINDVQETIDIIEKLKKKDISFAIDDFGTGYSSLSYLKVFPVDVIKIDQSFIQDVEHDASNRTIIGAITVMAHQLGFKVLAEGVETEQQLEHLKMHNCDYVQGYYYAAAMPADELLEQYGLKGDLK